MTQIIHFGSYAGFRVLGTKPMARITEVTKNHVFRASWLTAQVESGGKYGCAISYDGTGVTACIHQAVALYPREVWEADGKTEDDQGPLWKILKRIQDAHPVLTVNLNALIEGAGWVLAADGMLRRKTGGFPSGKEMRKELNGDVNGKTPSFGPDHERSERWVKTFSDLMSNGYTFNVQDASGEEFIVKRATKAYVTIEAGSKVRSIQDALYDGKDVATVPWQDLGADLDLAMCVFWSHSVNAPGMALQCLDKAIKRYGQPTSEPAREKSLPWILIRVLGQCSYGRWEEDIRGGRYQRTRDAAIESQLWPDELFETIMPADLPG